MFFLPKLELSLTFLGPSAVLVLNSKSGALAPTVKDIIRIPLKLTPGLPTALGYKFRACLCQTTISGLRKLVAYYGGFSYDGAAC